MRENPDLLCPHCQRRGQVSTHVILILIFALSVLGCKLPLTSLAPEGNPLPLSAAIVKDYSLRTLGYAELPLTGYAPTSIRVSPADAQGIILFSYNGRTYYHPVQIAQHLLVFLDNYRSTGIAAYFDIAKIYATKLLDLAVEKNGAIYFPYPFDYELNGSSGDIMFAPWYSGMAQGQVLECFVRLYEMTQNADYLDIAESILQSFYVVEGEADPWTVFVDPNGYYWIDEYPLPENTFTLNGHIFAIIGLYELWLIRPMPELERILKASINTIEYYAEWFRVPGGVSRYCLKYGICSERYHRIHVWQLAFLYRITGESFFLEMSEAFRNDYY